MHFVKFILRSGQQPPIGSMGICIPGTGWLVWQGEDGQAFPAEGVDHADMTTEEVASIQPAAILAYEAKRLLDSQDGQQALIRAVALAALEEINAVRNWLLSFKGQVAASANLADLKTWIAGMPDTTKRTRRQMVSAIRSIIDSGEA